MKIMSGLKHWIFKRTAKYGVAHRGKPETRFSGNSLKELPQCVVCACTKGMDTFINSIFFFLFPRGKTKREGYNMRDNTAAQLDLQI